MLRALSPGDARVAEMYELSLIPVPRSVRRPTFPVVMRS